VPNLSFGAYLCVNVQIIHTTDWKKIRCPALRNYLSHHEKIKTGKLEAQNCTKIRKKAVCLKVLTMSPKKPNSANRRVAKVNITHFSQKLTIKITGEAHNLQQHSSILLRGGRVRDLIGVRYLAIRGKFDLTGVKNRKTSRSLYGVKSQQ
jgi:small subunit ribosomal protein S12